MESHTRRPAGNPGRLEKLGTREIPIVITPVEYAYAEGLATQDKGQRAMPTCRSLVPLQLTPSPSGLLSELLKGSVNSCASNVCSGGQAHLIIAPAWPNLRFLPSIAPAPPKVNAILELISDAYRRRSKLPATVKCLSGSVEDQVHWKQACHY